MSVSAGELGFLLLEPLHSEEPLWEGTACPHSPHSKPHTYSPCGMASVRVALNPGLGIELLLENSSYWDASGRSLSEGKHHHPATAPHYFSSFPDATAGPFWWSRFGPRGAGWAWGCSALGARPEGRKEPLGRALPFGALLGSFVNCVPWRGGILKTLAWR